MKINAIIFLFLFIGINLRAQAPSTGVAGHPTSSADASTSKGFASAGCVELGGSMSLTSQNFIFAPYVGWFPVKGFELGLDPLLISIANNNTSLSVLFAPSYNFSTGSMVYPFVEADFGVSSTNGNQTGLTTGVRAGVKLEIAKHALLNVSVQSLSENFTENGVSVTNGSNLVVGAGFTIYL